MDVLKFLQGKKDFLYLYKAEVLKVYDGDTITVMIDLGMSCFVKEKIRLFGIDAPELRGEEKQRGIEARDHLANLLESGDVFILTKKDNKGKYGRYLADVYVHDSIFNDLINVNRTMVDTGHAVFKEY